MQRPFSDSSYADHYLGRVRLANVRDHQVVDSANEHLLYCVSDRKTPWHLPRRHEFILFSKVVITLVAKSRCKLAIYNQIEWIHSEPFASSLIKRAALQDMSLDALDLVDVLSDQVKRLVGSHGRTKKAITVFGQVGQNTQVSEFAGSDSPLAARLRRSRKRRTMTSLAIESSLSMLETIAASSMQIILQCLTWAWKTLNANVIILTILAFSVLTNLLFTSANTSEWWRDRKASKLMARLGIGPDFSMSKAIYLHDLEDATSLDFNSSPSPSKCRDTFNEIINFEESSPSSQMSFIPPKITKTTLAHRIKTTRHHLGSQRHDLLVAMRVVNSVEREMMQAEWEDWLVGENARCTQLGVMLRQNQTEPTRTKNRYAKNPAEAVDERHLELLESWHQDYCGSCSREQALL